MGKKLTRPHSGATVGGRGPFYGAMPRVHTRTERRTEREGRYSKSANPKKIVAAGKAKNHSTGSRTEHPCD